MIANDRFNAIEFATEQEYQVLLADKRIFLTQARLTGDEARHLLGGEEPFAPEVRTYRGYLVTDTGGDLTEANWRAQLRGFGETIVGVFEDAISWQEALLSSNN